MQERRPTEAEEAMISFTPQVGLARTYPISLDRNLNSQTLDKLVELCETIEIHQVALLVLAYSGNGSKKTDQPLSHARHELKLLAQIGDE